MSAGAGMGAYSRFTKKCAAEFKPADRNSSKRPARRDAITSSFIRLQEPVFEAASRVPGNVNHPPQSQERTLASALLTQQKRTCPTSLARFQSKGFNPFRSSTSFSTPRAQPSAKVQARVERFAQSTF
jgi:hypothetical protein